MADRALREECVKMRDDLVKSLRSSKLGVDEPVINEFVTFTNNYLKDMDKSHGRAEKIVGKTFADEELRNSLLKTFKHNIGIVREIVYSGVAPVYDETGSEVDVRIVYKNDIIRFLQVAKMRLSDRQDIAFQAAENEARSEGKLVEIEPHSQEASPAFSYINKEIIDDGLNNKALTEQCIKIRDDLVKTLRTSEYAKELKPYIKEFVEFTDNYLSDMGVFRNKAEKMVGKTLADEILNNVFLEKFQECLKPAIDSVERSLAPPPADYDPTDKKHVAMIKKYKEEDKGNIINALYETQNYLDIWQNLAFAASVRKSKLEGNLAEGSNYRN